MCAQPADYTFGERKFGGNAQAITKQRWLQHTSLLWDFDPANMALLKHPANVPDYRAVRPCHLCQCHSVLWQASRPTRTVPLMAVSLLALQGRDHLEFVCSLRDYMSRAALIDGIIHALRQSGLQAREASLQDAEAALRRDHIMNTKVVAL